MPQIELSPETIKALLEHPGDGIGRIEPLKVEVLFVGNESGFGGDKSIKDYLPRHLNPCPPQNRENNKSEMLQYINRLRNFLIDLNYDWFLNLNDLSKKQKQEVKSIKWEGSNCHIIDIRPFPRPNENFPLPFAGVKNKEYIRAFKDCDQRNTLVKQRLDSLRRTIHRFKNLKIIIAPGDPEMKKNWLSEIFNIEKYEFTEIKGITSTRTKRTKGPKDRLIKSEKIPNLFEETRYKVNGNEIQIIMTNFFNFNGIGLEGLKELSNQIDR